MNLNRAIDLNPVSGAEWPAAGHRGMYGLWATSRCSVLVCLVAGILASGSRTVADDRSDAPAGAEVEARSLQPRRLPVVAPRPEWLTRVDGPIQPVEVQQHIEWLAAPALEGRSGAGSWRAANRIARWFAGCGLQPLFPGGNWFQEIPGPARDGRPTVAGRNVGALLPGSDPQLRNEFVIVSAHYDHLGIRGGKMYRGADDNASGTSMMLEVARQLGRRKVRPRRSVVFVGFDLEERLLWGSRWFAAHPPWPLEQVCFFMTADMIGRSLGDLPLPTVFVLGSEHSAELRAALDAVPVPQGLEAARLGIDLVGTRSDYGPFRDRRIPFLFFSTGEHPDYHTPRDVPERIDSLKVARVSNLVLRLTEHVANAAERPQWEEVDGPNLEEARALHRICLLLMDAAGGKRLNGVQKLLVSHAKGRTAAILQRGEMTTSERSWLIRTAQLMLLSVF